MKSRLFNKLSKSGLCVAISMIVIHSTALAQDAQPKAATMSDESFWLLMLMGLVLFVAILVLMTTLFVVVVLQRIYSQELEKKGVKVVGVWDQIMNSLNRFTPVEQEKNILLDHNYDGIKELDNHLPPWWVYLFYGTVVYAVIYLFVYHIAEVVPTPEKEYQVAMETAAVEVAEYRKTMASNIDETNVAFLKDDKTALEAGKQAFDKNCVACHGKLLEGGTGPNLTDEFWLHGGSIQDVFKTIKYGVQEKGMIPWEKKLKPDVIQNVASYILSMQGTNPPNAKEAQGDKYESTDAAGEEKES